MFSATPSFDIINSLAVLRHDHTLPTASRYCAVGKAVVRMRNRSAGKQPAYYEKEVTAYIDAKYVSRSKYTPHIGRKQSGN
jgi:hypothetical protein